VSDLIDRWCEVFDLGVESFKAAADRIGVNRDTLRKTLSQACRAGDPRVPDWWNADRYPSVGGRTAMTSDLVARCLLLHADDLEVADHLDLAEKMRRRARLIAQGVKDA